MFITGLPNPAWTHRTLTDAFREGRPSTLFIIATIMLLALQYLHVLYIEIKPSLEIELEGKPIILHLCEDGIPKFNF